MSEPEPEFREAQTLREPTGAVFLMPPAVAEGELTPTMPLQANVGLTPADTAGNQWMTLQYSDGTISVSLRLPWQSAIQFSVAIAQQVQAHAQQAQAHAGPTLLIPGRNFPPGMPPAPPPNGGRRG